MCSWWGGLGHLVMSWAISLSRSEGQAHCTLEASWRIPKETLDEQGSAYSMRCETSLGRGCRIVSYWPLSCCLQIEMLLPCVAVAGRFKEQYRTFATALDATRHELPVRSVHLGADGQQFLGRKWGVCQAGLGGGQDEW